MREDERGLLLYLTALLPHALLPRLSLSQCRQLALEFVRLGVLVDFCERLAAMGTGVS
jgi:hypothetical protein